MANFAIYVFSIPNNYITSCGVWGFPPLEINKKTTKKSQLKKLIFFDCGNQNEIMNNDTETTT